MRILSIGFPLPNPAIDNYSVFTAPSYFDYPVMIIDPASITAAVRELLDGTREYEAFDGRPVLNAPTTATVVSAADQVQRRLEETQRLLEAGGTVVVLSQPNAVETGLMGFAGCDRYSWLPAPPGVVWGPPHMLRAEGRNVRLVADEHPFAKVVRENRKAFAYRAVFDDRQAVLRQAKVLATTPGGVPVGMEFEVLGGRIVFLPTMAPPAGNARSTLAQQFADALRQMGGEVSTETAPYWARSVAVPGLEQLEAELEEAETAAAEIEARLAEVRERHDELANHRRLLTADGPLLTRAVADALGLLGFAVTSPAGEPLIAESEGQTLFVETEGSRSEVVEWPYIRLQRRLEQRLLNEGSGARGLVVANGFREVAPEERKEQHTDALRIACENYRYCLITGTTLFALVQRALGGADEATLTGIRRRLLGTHGLLEPAVALGEVEEETDTGPIF